MKICATIAEFNPFHNGHSYLVNAFKHEFDGTIAIMSGNFVQRGAPAIYNKFARSRAAIANGIDLVIELPVVYALSSAENFASGAVKTLNATGCVNTLFFGSEEGSVEPLLNIAQASLNETSMFKELLKKYLQEGFSYPKALCKTYSSMGFDEKCFSSPNNILGIEYLKSLLETNSTIEPSTIKRFGAAHDSFIASHSIASASHIRSLVEKGSFTQNFMPHFPYPAPIFEKHFSHILLYALKSATKEDFTLVADCSPELASRFVKASAETNIDDIISKVKSKNFTESRIRRIIWNLALKNTLSPSVSPSYIRVLAQNKRGGEIIAHMKKTATLPIIQKGVQLKNDPIFMVESRATDIYNIIANLPSGEDFRYSPIPPKE